MTLKDIILSKPMKRTIISLGITIGALIGSKILYDYSVYSNLKYIKKRLGKIEIDEV